MFFHIRHGLNLSVNQTDAAEVFLSINLLPEGNLKSMLLLFKSRLWQFRLFTPSAHFTRRSTLSCAKNLT